MARPEGEHRGFSARERSKESWDERGRAERSVTGRRTRVWPGLHLVTIEGSLLGNLWRMCFQSKLPSGFFSPRPKRMRS